MAHRSPTTAVGYLCAALVLVSGCGGSGRQSDDVAIRSTADQTVGIGSTERIIPVDGDLAEIVYALGLGDQVVATDLSATYPPDADAKPEIGYQRALSPEPILAFEPTLVLATDVAGPSETLDALERLGVPVVVIPNPTTAEGPGAKVRAVARALGVSDAGERLAGEIDTAIAAVAATITDEGDAPTVAAFYMRGANVQLLFGDDTAVDWMIELVGGINVADELGVVGTRQINIEALVEAGPEVIVIPATGLESVGGIDGLSEIPGFSELPAVRSGRILAYDDQYLLGNGPRTADFLAEFAQDIHVLPGETP